MRTVLKVPGGFLDSDSGELLDSISLPLLLTSGKDGVISGFNLYPVICGLELGIRRDYGWTAYVHKQGQRARDEHVCGVIYYSRLTYRFPKGRNGGARPRTQKWRILNLELFCEFSEDPAEIDRATQSLISLAVRRGIKLPYSPGSFGGKLLRASPEWQQKRKPAPRFISEAARDHLPGNHYALRYGFKRVKQAIYLDQKSSHHTICSQIALPHPHFLRARGRFRAVERGESPRWKVTQDLLNDQGHTGVLIARVDCRRIVDSHRHLYPRWAQESGEKDVWLWTPELRLLGHNFYNKVKLIHISAGLTSYRRDVALTEYANWALQQLSGSFHPAVKPALLAAYGMLGVRARKGTDIYTVHGRGPSPRSEVVKLPLVDGPVYKSTVGRKWTPSIQNVVARGVIEAETMVRSLEYARSLELEKVPVLQVYADGLIVDTDRPGFMPAGWRWVGNLSNLSARTSNSVISDNLVRMPGIPHGRRVAHLTPA